MDASLVTFVTLMDEQGREKKDTLRWTPSDPVTAEDVLLALRLQRKISPFQRYKVIHEGRQVIDPIPLNRLFNTNMFHVIPVAREAELEFIEVKARLFDPTSLGRDVTLNVPNRELVSALDIINAAVQEGYLNDNINKIVVYNGRVLETVPGDELSRSNNVFIREGDVMEALRRSRQREAQRRTVDTSLEAMKARDKDFRMKVQNVMDGGSTNVAAVQAAGEQLIEAVLQNVGEIVENIRAYSGVAAGGGRKRQSRRRRVSRRRSRTGRSHRRRV